MKKTVLRETGAVYSTPLRALTGREELLAAIREAAPARGVEWETRKRGLALRTFTARTGWRMCQIQKYFPSWNEALMAAGGDVAAHLTSLTREELLADWGLVARKMQRPPPFTHYHFHGKYAAATLAKRFASWHNVRGAFREFAKGKEEWADVVKLCDMPARAVGRHGRNSRGMNLPLRQARDEPLRLAQGSGLGVTWTAKPMEDRPVFGEPLGTLPMGNAPTNESGVILLFGILAEQLGFHILSVRAGFPDCTALRKMGPHSTGSGQARSTGSGQAAGWQNVTVEFEYQSSNFHKHGHPPTGCDIIVCWAHDWADCPANLEVIALREVIQAHGNL